MNAVVFRDFEERDIDFVYKCKNDEKLNSLIVGQYHPFTYEEAVKWVRGCMGEHDNYKFWAISTNDDEKRIVGWVSLSEIDMVNKSTCFHGVVIGDKEYQDGFAWMEAYLFVLEYTFERMGMNRLYGSSIVGHKQSNLAGDLFLFTLEGIMRQAVYKNGRFYDVRISSVLKEEYFLNKEQGEYELKAILRRLKQLRNKYYENIK